MSAAFPGQDRAKHMGELKRGDERWDVFIEMQPDAEVAAGAVRGRLHFVSGERRRTTGWIFLELSERRSKSASGNFRPSSCGTSWRRSRADGVWWRACMPCVGPVTDRTLGRRER